MKISQFYYDNSYQFQSYEHEVSGTTIEVIKAQAIDTAVSDLQYQYNYRRNEDSYWSITKIPDYGDIRIKLENGIFYVWDTVLHPSSNWKEIEK